MKAQYWVIIVLVIILALYFNKNNIKKAMTRGYKNNNPGNLRPDGKQWIGEKPKSSDPGFKQFVSMPYGYRAMFVNLKGYLANGFNTIEKIISRWAPASDNNDTAAYIRAVTTKAGVPSTQQIAFTNTALMRKIVAAISEQENGVPADMNDLDEGFKLLTA